MGGAETSAAARGAGGAEAAGGSAEAAAASPFRVEYTNFFAAAESDEGDCFYDRVDLADFELDAATGRFTYPCPCGDMFETTLDELEAGELVARCPSCSLLVLVVVRAGELSAYR